MASGLNKLAAFLPGGTFLTYTVIAQITAEQNAMMRSPILNNAEGNATLAAGNATAASSMTGGYTELCTYNLPANDGVTMKCCNVTNVVTGKFCGNPTRFALTVTVTALSALICFMLALTGSSLDHTDAQGGAPQPRTVSQLRKGQGANSTADAWEAFRSMTDCGIIRTLCMASKFRFFDFVHATGSMAIFLVLAMLTPPVSMCFFGPCVPAVISQAVPLLIAFGGSALLAVWKTAVKRARRLQRDNLLAAQGSKPLPETHTLAAALPGPADGRKDQGGPSMAFAYKDDGAPPHAQGVPPALARLSPRAGSTAYYSGTARAAEQSNV